MPQDRRPNFSCGTQDLVHRNFWAVYAKRLYFRQPTLSSEIP
jgi:hypothetical protein